MRGIRWAIWFCLALPLRGVPDDACPAAGKGYARAEGIGGDTLPERRGTAGKGKGGDVAREYSLEEVVITGTRTPKPLKEAPVLTRVVTQKEIERLNPPDFQDLLESALPGLQFGRAHGSNLPQLSFQGVAGGYVLFLVDGERLAGEGASNNIDFSRVDIDNIARIEVVKGPMSTLYGSQAMGGVVNIITRDAERPLSGTLSARWGNKDEMKYAVSAGAKGGRLSSHTTLSYRRRDPYTVQDRTGAVTETHTRDTVFRDTARPSHLSVTGYEVWQAAQRFGYSFSPRLKGRVDGSYYHNRLHDPYAPRSVREAFHAATVHPLLTYSSGNHHATLSYLFDNYAKRERYTDGAPPRRIFRDRTHTARLHYDLFAERHTLSAGAEANAQQMEHYWFNGGRDTCFAQRNYVLYLQEEWRATEALTLIAGVRTDWHTAYGLHAAPKVSAMYRLGDFTLRGSYGMGFRTPTLKELHAEYDMGGLGAFMIYGNPALKPESGHQGTLSVEYTRGVFNGSLSGYYAGMRDAIRLALKDEGGDRIYRNAPRSRKSGVEAMGQVRLACGVMVNAAYAYVDCHETEDGYNTSAFRPHSLTFSANYTRRFGKVGTSASLNGRWLSKADVWEKRGEGIYVLRPYGSFSTLDLNLSARFPRGFRFTLGIDNLLDARAANVSSDPSIIPQRGIGFTTTLGIALDEWFK